MQADIKNLEKWKTIKGKFSGKRVFVIGSGPSITKAPLYLLKNEYTICFNRINLFFERVNWRPNFYVIIDDLKIREIFEEVNKEIIPVVDYAFFPDLHTSNVNFRKYLTPSDKIYWLNTDKPVFSLNLPHCGINKSVVNAALQILAYLGFSEIYLLGVDMTFKKRDVIRKSKRDWVSKNDDDSNHFDPRYDGKGMGYRNPTLEDMLEKFNNGKKFFEKHKVPIFNCTTGGNLECYPRKNLTDILKLTEKEQFKLFRELLPVQFQNLEEKQIVQEFTELNSIGEFNIGIEHFSVNKHIKNEFISKAIFTHIPYGPYKEFLYFVKRN